jgi:hypothetical protein
MLKVLGVHSNVLGDASLPDGHAWLSMHFENGNHTSIGLWTSSLGEARRFIKDPTGFMLGETHDVEFGIEDQKQYVAKASRYYVLTKDQAQLSTSFGVVYWLEIHKYMRFLGNGRRTAIDGRRACIWGTPRRHRNTKSAR